MSALTLKIVTPDRGSETISCDSISLWMAPDADGKGEGSIGIRKGHTAAVIALGNGPMEAALGGKKVFSAVSDEGFATVADDLVTVIGKVRRE